MKIELQGFESCPGLLPNRVRLHEVLEDLALGCPIEEVLVESDEDVRCTGFMGSPSLLVDGVYVAGRAEPAESLCCLVYESGPVPPRWMIEACVLRALSSGGVLFLCVANSARSQMAEGIARRLAGPDTEVFSAGSVPSQVHPLAIQVLDEIDIDIRGHSSKGTNEIRADAVDTVVTLCAKEVCPVWLGEARRVHWGLSDPAAGTGDDVQAFRAVRDELMRRLELLFGNRLTDEV